MSSPRSEAVRGVPAGAGILVLLAALHLFLLARVDATAPELGFYRERRWIALGESLYRHGSYSLPGPDGALAPTLTVPPLWPAVIWLSYAAFDAGATAHRALRALCVLTNLGVIALTWGIGRMLSPRVGVLAAILGALDLSSFFWATHFSVPDVPCGFFFTAALLLFFGLVRQTPAAPRGAAPPSGAARLLLCGLFLGLAAWTKPQAGVLWVPLLLFLLVLLRFRQRCGAGTTLRAAAMLALMPVLFILLWCTRNWLATGHFAYSSQFGRQALIWSGGYLTAYQEGIDFAEASGRLLEQYTAGGRVEQMSEGERDAYYLAEGRKLIFASPVDYAWVVLRNTPPLLFGTCWPDFMWDAGERRRIAEIKARSGPSPPGFLTNAAFLAEAWRSGRHAFVTLYLFVKAHIAGVYLAALAGALLLSTHAGGAWLTAGIVTIVAANTALGSPASHDRYRYPVMPLVYVLAGRGVAGLLDASAKRLRAGG
jgi:hypothetical protein